MNTWRSTVFAICTPLTLILNKISKNLSSEKGDFKRGDFFFQLPSHICVRKPKIIFLVMHRALKPSTVGCCDCVCDLSAKCLGTLAVLCTTV